MPPFFMPAEGPERIPERWKFAFSVPHRVQLSCGLRNHTSQKHHSPKLQPAFVDPELNGPCRNWFAQPRGYALQLKFLPDNTMAERTGIGWCAELVHFYQQNIASSSRIAPKSESGLIAGNAGMRYYLHVQTDQDLQNQYATSRSGLSPDGEAHPCLPTSHLFPRIASPEACAGDSIWVAILSFQRLRYPKRAITPMISTISPSSQNSLTC